MLAGYGDGEGISVAVGARVVAVERIVLVAVAAAVDVAELVGVAVGVTELVGVRLGVDVPVAVAVTVVAIGAGVAVMGGRTLPASTPAPKPAPKTRRPSASSTTNSDRCLPWVLLSVCVSAMAQIPR